MKSSPIPSHRQAEILRELAEAGSVSVTDLAERFSVAGETIRRDFDKLARMGRLLRTHGGAVALETPGTLSVEPSLVERSALHADEKRAIAELAIGRVIDAALLAHDDPVVAVDASSTALELVRRLPNCEMTVISNSMDVIRELIDRPLIRAIATGGEYEPRGACFVGPLAESALRQFAVHVACFSCRAVDRARGCSEASLAHSSFKRLMIDVSERNVLLVDASKLNQKSVAFFAPLGELDEVITSAPEESEAFAWLEDSGARVSYALERVPGLFVSRDE